MEVKLKKCNKIEIREKLHFHDLNLLSLDELIPAVQTNSIFVDLLLCLVVVVAAQHQLSKFCLNFEHCFGFFFAMNLQLPFANCRNKA